MWGEEMTPATLIKQAKQLYAIRAAWLGEGGQPSPLAQERANVCATCPQNQQHAFEELFKGPAARIVRMQLELRSKLELRVEGEERLHTCALCGCWLKLKVHVPLRIAREGTPDWGNFPEWCWLRTEG